MPITNIRNPWIDFRNDGIVVWNWSEIYNGAFIPWDSWPMVRDVIDRERKLRFPALTPEDYAEESNRKAIEIHYNT